MRADVNTSKKIMRDAMKGGCGPNPLCEPCGFKDKHVPEAWKTSYPGTRYPCNDPNIGKEVLLPGSNRPAVVVGCATPVGPSLLQMGRTTRRRECEGALVVRTPLGIETVVTRSVVRERRRLTKPGRGTCKCTGLPYPHREGSDPLCERAAGGLEELRAQERDAYEGGDRDEQNFLASVRRASKGRAGASLDDAAAFVKSLGRRQELMHDEAQTRALTPKRVYKARIAKAKAIAREMGWAV